MNQNQESVLFKTSAASDVQCSGGVLTIAGLSGTKKSRISSILQVKSKAEVVQVITVGATSYTPTGSTRYAVLIGDTNRIRNGAAESLKLYSYTTPSDVTTLGATAALQREAISVALVAAINADDKNFVVAATLGTGTGFTITDDAGYYPAFSQTGTGRLGASTVVIAQNADDTGYAATNITTTTAAVYASGIGATLSASVPVVDALYGGLLSGYLSGSLNGFSFTTKSTTAANNNLPAVTGQNYDIFVIASLTDAPAHQQRGQLALVPKVQAIAVDNGTGTATTNLAGFKAFERALLYHIFDVFKNDPSVIITMGDTAAVSQGLGTGLPSGVAQAENVIVFGNGFAAHYSPIATSTIIAPVSTNDGLSLILDATVSEGIELSAPTWANSTKEFVVGKTEFSVYAKVTIDDVSGLNPFWVGFRKKEAYVATFANYTDYAVVGLGDAAGNIFTSIELNSGGATSTDTTLNWADAETKTLEVRVSIGGVATFYVNGAQVNASTSFTFDAGDSVIPTVYALQAADIGIPSLLELAAVPSATWRS